MVKEFALANSLTTIKTRTMVNRILHTISSKWIMRHDVLYYNTYALYNIETRQLIRITPSLYTLLHLFYDKALAYDDIKSYLTKQGVCLKWNTIDEIEREFGFENLFVKSDVPFHSQSDLSPVKETDVPITASPMDVELLLTHNCNLKCKHCFQSSESHSDRRNHLSVSEWKRIFRQLESVNVYNVIISGGEPMIYPHFEELLRIATDLRMSFSILTNGMLISDSNLDIFKKKNVSVTISLDGATAELHEYLRGRNTYKRLMRNIELLVENDVKLNIAHVVNTHNKKHLEELVCFLIDKGVKNLSINLVEPEGRASSNSYLILNSKEEQQMREKINCLQSRYADRIKINFPNLSYRKNIDGFSKEEKVYCAAGTKRVAISSDGCVYPCVYAFNLPFLKMGDLKRESLQNIWKKETEWRLMRGGITTSQIYTCNSCKLQRWCSMRNCRIKFYSQKWGLYAKPDNCLLDKIG